METCTKCEEEVKFIAAQELAQKRFDICKVCDSFEPKLARCSECGCFMKVKVKLGRSQCPLGKW